MSAEPKALHNELMERAARQPWRLTVKPIGCTCCAALSVVLGTIHAATFKMRDEEIRDARNEIDLYLERKLRNAEEGVPLAVAHLGHVDRRAPGRRSSDYRLMRNLQQTRNNIAYLAGQMAKEGREGNYRGALETEVIRLDRELRELVVTEPTDSTRAQAPAMESTT